MPGQVRGDDMMAVTELPGASANAVAALELLDPVTELVGASANAVAALELPDPVTELPGASANATVALTLPDPDDAAVEGSGLTDSYKAIFN